MAEGYVANWGSDLNGGTSWETAKRSLQGAIDAGLYPINARGFFNEAIQLNKLTIGYRGLYLKDRLNTSKLRTVLKKSEIEGYYTDALGGLEASVMKYDGANNCLMQKSFINSIILIKNTFHLVSGVPMQNNTIFCGNLLCRRLNKDVQYDNIIIADSIQQEFSGVPIDFRNSLLSVPLWRFEDGDYLVSGSDDVDKIQNLKDRMAAVYGGSPSDYLEGCRYYSGSYNDVFVDADNGNFYLKDDLNNPALGIGYNGENAGAKPVAAITTNIATANTLTNINNTTGAITDQNLDASAYWTTIQDAGTVRKIASFEAIAEIAYRNGLSINPVEYMSADIIPGSNRLTSGKQYQVRDDANTGGTIVLDDSGETILSVWETFTAVDEGGGAGLGFTSVDNLTVREIDITKYNERIRIKVSTDDATLATANKITMLLHETPLVNVDASNIPTAGNGDVTYDPNTAVPLQARYMQVWVDIQSDQLFAR